MGLNSYYVDLWEINQLLIVVTHTQYDSHRSAGAAKANHPYQSSFADAPYWRYSSSLLQWQCKSWLVTVNHNLHNEE